MRCSCTPRREDCSGVTTGVSRRDARPFAPPRSQEVDGAPLLSFDALPAAAAGVHKLKVTIVSQVTRTGGAAAAEPAPEPVVKRSFKLLVCANEARRRSATRAPPPPAARRPPAAAACLPPRTAPGLQCDTATSMV